MCLGGSFNVTKKIYNRVFSEMDLSLRKLNNKKKNFKLFIKFNAANLECVIPNKKCFQLET